MILGAFERARDDLLEASICLQAFARGEHGTDADVGGLLVAEFITTMRTAFGAR